MAEQKTKPTSRSVDEFIESVADEGVRDDCRKLTRIMKKITGSAPKMWGPTIIGFGTYHYKYESGHEGDSCLTGFSPRKANTTIYVMPGFTGQTDLQEKLGKHKAGKGCLYIKRLDDVDLNILTKMIEQSVNFLKKKYPSK